MSDKRTMKTRREAKLRKEAELEKINQVYTMELDNEIKNTEDREA